MNLITAKSSLMSCLASTGWHLSTKFQLEMLSKGTLLYSHEHVPSTGPKPCPSKPTHSELVSAFVWKTSSLSSSLGYLRVSN